MGKTKPRVMDKNKKYMSVAEMGKMLGLKKGARYWLIRKGCFRVVTLCGKMWVDVESFEKWYAGQIHYHKVNGEEPGKEITEKTYSLQEIMEMLNISQCTMYEILAWHDFDIIRTDQKQRISKESFWKWYKGQNHYRIAEDRKETEAKAADTLTIKEAADLLGINKSSFEAVMRHWYFGQYFDYVKIDRLRRITKNSFLLFLKKQDKYFYDPLQDKTVTAARGEYYLTIEQASWYCREDQRTIMDWYKNGKVSAVRAGRKILIPLTDLKTAVSGIK